MRFYFIFALILSSCTKSYEDCLLENIKPNSNISVIETIEKACQLKHKKTKIVFNEYLGLIEFPNDMSNSEISDALQKEVTKKLAERDKSRLQSFRDKYPEYNDMSDEDLINKIYKKFYFNMNFQDYLKMINS